MSQKSASHSLFHVAGHETTETGSAPVVLGWGPKIPERDGLGAAGRASCPANTQGLAPCRARTGGTRCGWWLS